MLQQVNAGHKSLADYRSIIRRDLYEEIQDLSERVKGARVLHVNATAFGGGVAEILYTLVPLMRDAGVEAEWGVMLGAEPFFNVTKGFHNALQGAPYDLTIESRAIYEEYNRESAAALERSGKEWDIVFVHDPSPPSSSTSPAGSGRRPSGSGAATSTPRPRTRGPELPFSVHPRLRRPDLHDEGVHPARRGAPGPRHHPPAIDPLSPKNMALSTDDARFITNQFGVDPERPFLLQVSRFDPWKDPLGVIDAYRMVKEEIPEVQLVLVGSMAHDDPEGWDYWYKTVNYAAGDSDIFLFSNLTNVGAIEVNAFQSLADVVIQKSIREGFGLVVTEGLWKARPLVAGRVGGIPMQVDQGGGILVDNVPEAAAACTKLLKDPEFARRMGRHGKEHVREHYLTPRLLRDDLKLFAELLNV
ncbi:glycosyltransferase [Rubrobacter marinus]|uniref:glycosyltransferase n=1 Tax=Rubrobacter marinus TaxID=2653852 RepID=UPI001D18CA5A|nr:glycosyltransferase [Rubrobacter marinus]